MAGLRLGLGLSPLGLTSGQGGGAPAGYTRSTINGQPATFNSAPVYDNSPTNPLSVRTA